MSVATVHVVLWESTASPKTPKQRHENRHAQPKLEVAAALKFSKYDYELVYGDGAHNGDHGGAILPNSLRWLWRDVP